MNYKNIRLDKSMYKAEGGFSRQLENIDPSAHYRGTELEGLDAFQRQLKRFDIKVSGKNSDTLSKFFASTDSAALFPEYVSRAVLSGMTGEKQLQQLLASTSDIHALDYRAIQADIAPLSDNLVGEGKPIPQTEIKLSDTLIRLKKRGQLLTASYEALKHQRADVVAVALGQIGNALAKAQLEDAVVMLQHGDGDTMAPAGTVSASGRAFTYEDLLDLWCEFKDFEMNTLVVSPNTMRELLLLPEFRESAAGEAFLTDGTILTPFGAKMLSSQVLEDEYVLALDNRYALEMVTSGGVQVEYDKLIDTQLERAAVTTTYGFSKLFVDGCKVLQRGM